MRKICAIIVTYNRPELLCRCVKALLQQDTPVHVFIYDNHSRNRADEYLRSQELLPQNDEAITYYYAEENTGGAGGFHNALRMAEEMQFDEFILMDDDGFAINENTVSQLLLAREKVGDYAIVNSLVVCDPDTLQLSFSLNRSYDGKLAQSWAQDGLLEKFISPFNGTMVSKEIVRKIGYPRKEFFVYGDETEYTLRALKNGISLYTAVNSLYYHPTYIGMKKKFLGHTFTVSDIPMWKVYCSARNSTYYSKLYFGCFAVAKTILRLYLNVPLCPRHKLMRAKYITRGIWDGLCGNFSRKLDLSK